MLTHLEPDLDQDLQYLEPEQPSSRNELRVHDLLVLQEENVRGQLVDLDLLRLERREKEREPKEVVEMNLMRLRGGRMEEAQLLQVEMEAIC